MKCPKCGLPQELCVCEEIVKEERRIVIRSDKRSYGKVVTIVDGLEGGDATKIMKELKRKLACGGTLKSGRIELQGNHVARIKQILTELGFPEENIEVY